MAMIHFVERNYHGAWVVWGVIGIRQYYDYTKKRAIELYKEEVCNTMLVSKTH